MIRQAVFIRILSLANQICPSQFYGSLVHTVLIKPLFKQRDLNSSPQQFRCYYERDCNLKLFHHWLPLGLKSNLQVLKVKFKLRCNPSNLLNHHQVLICHWLQRSIHIAVFSRRAFHSCYASWICSYYTSVLVDKPITKVRLLWYRKYQTFHLACRAHIFH